MSKQSVGTRNSADLRSLTLFARVIETRSLTAAGRMLEMTTSSASKRLSDLEARLGVRLIERTTRHVWPTAAGTAFYERCAKILTEIDDAELAAMELGGNPRGLLRASVPVAIGELHIAPLAAMFGARYPEIQLDIALSDLEVNLADGAFDLAVQLSPLRDSNLVAKRLATDRAIACGAPSYFDRCGIPKSPSDLLSHDCLHLSHLTVHDEWSFTTPDGPVSVPLEPRALFNHSGAVRAAAIAGLGIANMPRLAVSDALRSGELMSVLEDYGSRELTVAVVYLAGKQRSRKVGSFVDFLVQELPPRLI